MKQITVTIDGMHCPKCAAKVEAAIADKFAIKSVKASHTENNAVILTEHPLDEEALTALIKAAGFTVTAIQSEDAPKKRLVAKIFKK